MKRGAIFHPSMKDVIQEEDAVHENCGRIIREPYPEVGLTVALFSDVEGNVLGVWQRGSLE